MCIQCSTTVLLRVGVLEDFKKVNGNIAQVSRAVRAEQCVQSNVKSSFDIVLWK